MGATHLAGVTFGLVAGGLLFSIYEPLPFIVGAGLLVVTTAVTLWAAHTMRLGQGGDVNGDDGSGGRQQRPQWHFRKEIEFWKELVRDRNARWFLAANVLWNAGTEGIRPYLFLFATVVLGIAVQTASLAMLAFLAAAAVGSVIVGRVGDRFGRSRVLLAGAIVTGLAMMPGFFVRDLLWLMVLLVPAGIGAAALVSLPYPVFATIAGESDIGRSTGAFYMSVGLARMSAPLVVGAAIDLAVTWMPDQKGFPAMWPAAGAMTLMGAVTLYLAMRGEDWEW
jgi:predicted MFS family arabinose efflux permease